MCLTCRAKREQEPWFALNQRDFGLVCAFPRERMEIGNVPENATAVDVT